MKKLVLLGDSIRLIGYGTVMQSVMGSEWEVWQPGDNSRFAAYTLRQLYDYRDAICDADVIHWNNGLWDSCVLFDDGPFTPVDDYVRNMLRVNRLLHTYAPRVIFATTTPVLAAGRDPSPEMRNERTRAYNEAVVPLLRETGTEINDLYNVVLPHIREYIRDDLIHLNDAGIAACAAAVRTAVLNENH